MKKSELQSIIREEIKNVLREKEESPKEDPSLSALQKKMDDLSKVAKKVPADLKGKLVKKLKTTQSDIDTYKDSLKTKKDDK